MSSGNLVIREARRRAGLSQRELAGRLGTSGSAVARWEAGAVEPGWGSVVRAVRACGLDLRISLVEADAHDLDLDAQRLRHSPEQRLADMLAMVSFVEAGREAMAAARSR